jgi:probable rRNA maturation factor
MKAECIVDGSVSIPRPATLARLAEKVLRGEGMHGRINLVFCENDHVRELNKRFRKLDKVTDVLSFLYEEEDVLGEIYIASAQAKKQAPKWKNTFYDELRRLVVHGSLHLAGFDHMNAKDRKLMRAREDLYLGLTK